MSFSFAGKKNPCGKVDNYRTVTAKFVVSRCVFCKLRGVFWFFCSVNHFSEGGVNTNHYVMCLPSLAENVSRLLKNSKGNGDGEWMFWWRKEADYSLDYKGWASRCGRIAELGWGWEWLKPYCVEGRVGLCPALTLIIVALFLWVLLNNSFIV